MFLVQRSFTRSSTEVPFFKGTDQYVAHFKSTYLDTNKCSNNSITLSSDRLKLIFVLSWETEDAFNEYVADPAVQEHQAARTAYNTANNIIESDRVTTSL